MCGQTGSLNTHQRACVHARACSLTQAARSSDKWLNQSKAYSVCLSACMLSFYNTGSISQATGALSAFFQDTYSARSSLTATRLISAPGLCLRHWNVDIPHSPSHYNLHLPVQRLLEAANMAPPLTGHVSSWLVSTPLDWFIQVIPAGELNHFKLLVAVWEMIS